MERPHDWVVASRGEANVYVNGALRVSDKPKSNERVDRLNQLVDGAIQQAETLVNALLTQRIHPDDLQAELDQIFSRGGFAHVLASARMTLTGDSELDRGFSAAEARLTTVEQELRTRATATASASHEGTAVSDFTAHEAKRTELGATDVSGAKKLEIYEQGVSDLLRAVGRTFKTEGPAWLQSQLDEHRRLKEFPFGERLRKSLESFALPSLAVSADVMAWSKNLDPSERNRHLTTLGEGALDSIATGNPRPFLHGTAKVLVAYLGSKVELSPTEKQNVLAMLDAAWAEPVTPTGSLGHSAAVPAHAEEPVFWT